MKWILFFLCLGSQIANAQVVEATSISGSLGKGVMPVGVYYYPEHWHPAQWDRDLKRISELGFEFTHFGEFAWANMEPTEGNFDFEWLDRAVEIAQKYGLKVIMCTPTPTPPAWLTSKHPEILSVNSDYITQQHGSRLHVVYDHPVYLTHVRKIVEQLARRYGHHPAVAGWQLDNEPHFGTIEDYSVYAEQQFPLWLKKRYGTIETLNHAWGTKFWSQAYNYFEQIKLPNKKTAPQGVNPHALLDYQRFMMDRLAVALRFQAEILREHVSVRQWITTNYAYYKFLPLTDPFRNKRDLNFASHTMYLTSGFLNDEGGPLAFRLGSGMELSFSAELSASVNGFTGIMELQPGQINWGVINPQPLPEAVRMWVWHAYALGDKFLCAYRFRQPLFGSEQTHKGIMETDGISLARGGAEYVQAINEIKKLKTTTGAGILSTNDKNRRTAFLWDMANMNDIENHRHHKDFDPWQHVYDYYSALKSMGSPVTFVQPDEKIDHKQYPFMVVPSYQQANKEMIKNWEEYVKNGGHLIISCRTAKKDLNGHLWEAPNQQPIYSLIGGTIPEFDHLPSNHSGRVSFNGKLYEWYRWGDWIQPEGDTEVLATYQDQFYGQTAAVIKRHHGKGTVTYVGVWSNDGQLEKDLLCNIYQKAGVKVFQLPKYVFTGWREGYRVFVNYSSEAYQIPMDSENEIVLGESLLKPGGVTVLKERK